LLHHILLVCSKLQMDEMRAALARLKATPIEDGSTVAEGFHLDHPLMDQVLLNIHLINDLDGITAHLRQNAVDLLIYDERNGHPPAHEGLKKIREDVKEFAAMWGPDFLFPMSRVVAILENTGSDPKAAFELGRVQVRDVLISPKNTAAILRWLKRVLLTGIQRKERVGMALSGGGLEGFLYQLGVVHALEKSISGRSLRNIHGYAGISSGSICAALMSANVPTLEVIRAMNDQSKTLKTLKGSMLFDLDAKNIVKRVVSHSVSWAGVDPQKWLNKITRSVPTGFFKGDVLEEYFFDTIQAFGQEDSFNSVQSKLYIGATDQDTFEHVTLGKEPWTDISVSKAMRASCALPPFFTPTKINGRWFIDGQVTKTTNLELLVEDQCRLIMVIDPMKPLGTMLPGSVDRRGGVFAVIQTIKALINTRFKSSLRHVTERYPDVDFMVFQPSEECAQIMSGSPMKYKIRTKIIEIAFRQTIHQLRERHHVYSSKLGRFGFHLLDTDELMMLEKDLDIVSDEFVEYSEEN
jgi:predicted acylesterase/phospholipase RssA